MKDEEIKETLAKQLQLLYERSKDVKNLELVSLTDRMILLADYLESGNLFSDEGVLGRLFAGPLGEWGCTFGNACPFMPWGAEERMLNHLGTKKEVSMGDIHEDLKEIARLLGKIEAKLPETDIRKLATDVAGEINHVLQSRAVKTDSKNA